MNSISLLLFSLLCCCHYTRPVAAFASSCGGRTARQQHQETYATKSNLDFDILEPPTDDDELGHEVDDMNDEDSEIRDALKRELLLLASVTNRGEYTSADERDIVIDLVTQLEALNPTPRPASNCRGDWDLCLASTQFFRASPFFQAIRVAMGESNKEMAANGFDLHDKATSISRVGRVRQIIDSDTLVSEVDLEVGLLPGLPFKVRGTVVTSAGLEAVSDSKWELFVESTRVTGSNVPVLSQLLEEQLNLQIPVGDIYSTVKGSNPAIPMETFYLDESMRITRDIDDNFFVFTRA